MIPYNQSFIETSMKIFATMPYRHKQLLIGAAIVLAVALLIWIWSSAAGSQYLRTTASLADRDTTLIDETVKNNVWQRFRNSDIPVTFDAPVEWQVTTQATSGGESKRLDLKNIQIWVYENQNDDLSAYITPLLGVSSREQISYPAKLGTTTGTMWAKASVVENTKAPMGERVYIPTATRGLVVILLPAPPYSDIQLRIMNSLAAN
jgi:hypothetical protein